jgi:PAS domain-containing protein
MIPLPSTEFNLESLLSERTDAITRYLAAIVESSDDAIVSKSLNGIITSWNKGAERIFGYRSEEIVGKPIIVLIPPERHAEEPTIIDCPPARKLGGKRRISKKAFSQACRCRLCRLADAACYVDTIFQDDDTRLSGYTIECPKAHPPVSRSRGPEYNRISRGVSK